jgi:TusA-related sulfurtransferase
MTFSMYSGDEIATHNNNIIIIIFISTKSNTVQDVEKSIQNKQYKVLSNYSYNSKYSEVM